MLNKRRACPVCSRTYDEHAEESAQISHVSILGPGKIQRTNFSRSL